MAEQMATTPDAQAFHHDVESAVFLSGEKRGRWRLIRIAWPFAVIAVRARDQSEYFFRFDCKNYPALAPTAQPWSSQVDAPAAPPEWPKGTGRVAAVFRSDWKGGTALYLPCDRVSIDGHPNWRTEYPSML